MTPGGIYQSRASVSQQEGVFLQVHTGKTAGAGFLHEEMELVGGEGVVEAFRADVGDAVPFGVGAAGPGRPGEVEAEAVGRGESRTFANEQDDQRGSKPLADLVADGHATLEDNMQRRETPAFQLGQKGVQQGRCVPFDRQGRQTIGHDEGRVVVTRREQGRRIDAKAAAEVGATQVSGAIGCGTVEQDMRRQVARVQSLVDGIAGAGMIELEAQEFGGGQAVTGPAQGDARVGEGSQVNSHWFGVRLGCESSQASNSGAGFRPSVERR